MPTSGPISPTPLNASPPAAPDFASGDEARLVLCIPIFNDWRAAGLLLEKLDQVAAGLTDRVVVVLVDDGSTLPPPKELGQQPNYLEAVCVLRLRRNVGHQRAIALGLAFIYHQLPCREVVVMDGDGEDPPEAIPRLLAHCRQLPEPRIVFAKRGKRSEGMRFRLGYRAYRLVHYLLTGRRVEVGNFSVVPFPLLHRLMGVSELWNHYAAAVIHARLPLDMIPVDRARRLDGKSQMSTVPLVIHGFSAISVFADVVGVRLLAVAGVLGLLLLSGIATVIYLRLFTEQASPGWATSAVGGMASVLLELLLLVVMVLSLTESRSQARFLPIRDWHYYIDEHCWLHVRSV